MMCVHTDGIMTEFKFIDWDKTWCFQYTRCTSPQLLRRIKIFFFSVDCSNYSWSNTRQMELVRVSQMLFVKLIVRNDKDTGISVLRRNSFRDSNCMDEKYYPQLRWVEQYGNGK